MIAASRHGFCRLNRLGQFTVGLLGYCQECKQAWTTLTVGEPASLMAYIDTCKALGEPLIKAYRIEIDT